MITLKIWHYLNYLYSFVQRKTNAFLGAYGSFWKFQEVSQSCNILQLGLERCGSASVLSVGHVLAIINAKILYKCDETSLTVTRIAVSFTLK